MGGKLSKKKKASNVSDDKAKDKKVEGSSAEEGAAQEENKGEAPEAATTDVANDKAQKEAQPVESLVWMAYECRCFYRQRTSTGERCLQSG
uniref:Uncharacterized protein n=1 Tax=Paramormyrops kingsleyae TaxID=1676925 RepID=A0A3B3TEI0_9TELE